MDDRLADMADMYALADMLCDGSELSVMNDMAEHVSDTYELDCDSLRRAQIIQNTALSGDTCW